MRYQHPELEIVRAAINEGESVTAQAAEKITAHPKKAIL
jgi:hypothetical protein